MDTVMVRYLIKKVILLKLTLEISEGHFLDALQVAGDETDTLDVILAEFEEQLIQDQEVPLACCEGHEVEVYEHYYHYEHGPPSLLFFEATSRPLGIPRSCIVPQIVLTERRQSDQLTEYYYDLVSVVSVKGEEDDLILEHGENTEANVVALVIYKCNKGPWIPPSDVDSDEESVPMEDENENVSMEEL